MRLGTIAAARGPGASCGAQPSVVTRPCGRAGAAQSWAGSRMLSIRTPGGSMMEGNPESRGRHPMPFDEASMNGTDNSRGLEYTALTQQARDLGRTAQWCWTGASVAAAFLLSSAISAHHPGMLLPVELCAAFAFYATLQSRRLTKSIESHLREFHESGTTEVQWFTQSALAKVQPGFQDRSEWVPMILSNAIMFLAVVYSWVFVDGAAHGEMMAAFATMGAMAFSVHSLVENMKFEQLAIAPAVPVGTVLREVPAVKRVG